MTRRHHTRDEWDAGLLLLDRIGAHTFAVDPEMDRPESFDIGLLLGYVTDLVTAERDVRDFLLGLPSAQLPVTWLHYDDAGQLAQDIMGWI